MRRLLLALTVTASLLALGCDEGTPDDPDTGSDATNDAGDDAHADTTFDTGADGPGDTGAPEDTTSPDAGADTGVPRQTAQLVHKFPDRELPPGKEEVVCLQWTLHNDKPLYVNTVTLANEGGFHHSNWYVVPESYAAGEDGFFNCGDRKFQEVAAALQGTVLFAQSTQAQSEAQKFPEGVVVKIPPNSKIVANTHFLNIAPRTRQVGSRMTLDLLHPAAVDTVVVPFRLLYRDLQIPPKSQSRFSADCNLQVPYENRTNTDFDLDLYYVLPHYHELGNYFSLEYFGGPKDGETIFELQGFNAEANGQTFDPPIDMSGAKGLRFTCGYDNPRDEEVGWGIGDQEMCVMLGFADSESLMDAHVNGGTSEIEGGPMDGIQRFEGNCNAIALGKTDAHTPPEETEKTGEMYVPETDAADNDLDPIPECEDTPADAQPLRPANLTNLSKDVFEVSCAFSSCHGADGRAAGLNLKAEDLHAELLNHEMTTPTDLPLVDPGNPEGSWLYRVTSECNPTAGGTEVSHMPRNSPTLMDPGVVAMIRDWIAQGAQDN